MTVSMSAIVTAIAALSITGLDIKALNEIPESWDNRQPALFPRPADFVTDCVVERQSFGVNGVAKKDLVYTLHFTFMYAPIGSGRGLLEKYDGMVTMACLILDTLAATSLTAAGAVQAEVDMSMFGPVSDPAGNAGHGCDFAIHIREFIV